MCVDYEDFKKESKEECFLMGMSKNTSALLREGRGSNTSQKLGPSSNLSTLLEDMCVNNSVPGSSLELADIGCEILLTTIQTCKFHCEYELCSIHSSFLINSALKHILRLLLHLSLANGLCIY